MMPSAPLRSRRNTVPSEGTRNSDDSRTSREKILDAAEALFADKGYNGASTRDITAAANANLGMISYYFGSKEKLFKEVIERRAIPELEERAAAVGRVLSAAGDGVPDLADVLRADLDAMFHLRRENAVHRRLAGRLSTDPSVEVRRVINEIYSRTAVVFDLALRRACPHLSDEEFYWRFYCLCGAVQYVLADVGKIQTLAGPEFDTSDSETALKYVVPFLAARLRAPSVRAIESAAPNRTARRDQNAT
jgi:AcrR family transcriptional regulator